MERPQKILRDLQTQKQSIIEDIKTKQDLLKTIEKLEADMVHKAQLFVRLTTAFKEWHTRYEKTHDEAVKIIMEAEAVPTDRLSTSSLNVLAEAATEVRDVVVVPDPVEGRSPSSKRSIDDPEEPAAKRAHGDDEAGNV